MAERLDAKFIERVIGSFNKNQYGTRDPDGVLRVHLQRSESGEAGFVALSKHKLSVNQEPYRFEGIELQLVLDGTATEAINGKQVQILPQSLIIFNQNVTRALLMREQDHGEILHIYLDRHLFDQRFFTLVMDDNMFANYVDSSLYLNLSFNDYLLVKDVSDAVKDVFFSLIHEYTNINNNEQPNQRILFSWVAVLFLRLYDYCREIEYDVGNDELESSYKKRLVNSILSNIQSEVKTATLSSVAQNVHLHPNYICKLLKETTGKTFSEILNQEKMRNAMQMLKMTEESLDQIAANVGYNNSNYFYKVFKNYFGQTPGQYRKQHQSKNAHLWGSSESTDAAKSEQLPIAAPAVSISEPQRFTLINPDQPRIGFFPAGDYKYIMEVGKGLAFSASKFGAKTRMYVPQSDDVNEQARLLMQAYQEPLDVIVINAHDESVVEPAVKRFMERGTMVCLINRDDSHLSLDVHSVIGYRQRQATRKLGEYVVHRMRGLSVYVGIIQGSTGYHSVERCGGFLDAIKEKENFEVASIYNGNWSYQGGYAAAMQMLQAQPFLNMVFCANDHEAVGVARAIKELGLRNILLFGNDGDSDGLNCILSGEMTATVGTNAYEMGCIAAQSIQRGLEGNLQAGFVETKTQVVDSSNAQIYLNLAKSYQGIYG